MKRKPRVMDEQKFDMRFEYLCAKERALVLEYFDSPSPETLMKFFEGVEWFHRKWELIYSMVYVGEVDKEAFLKLKLSTDSEFKEERKIYWDVVNEYCTNMAINRDLALKELGYTAEEVDQHIEYLEKVKKILSTHPDDIFDKEKLRHGMDEFEVKKVEKPK